MKIVEMEFMDSAEKHLTGFDPSKNWQDSALALAVAAFGQTQYERGMAIGGNYTADDDTFPTEVQFANGRRVGIAFDGDKPYLTVGMKEQIGA